MKRLVIAGAVVALVVWLALAPVQMLAGAIVYAIQMVALAMTVWTILWLWSIAWRLIMKTVDLGRKK